MTFGEHRLFFTQDRKRLVPESDPEARTLAVAPGVEVPVEVQPHYQRWLDGYSGEEGGEVVHSSAADVEPAPGGAAGPEVPRAVLSDEDTPEAAAARAKMQAAEEAAAKANQPAADEEKPSRRSKSE